MASVTASEHPSPNRRRPIVAAAFASTVGLWAAAWPGPAAADLGPCKVAAPTTRDVHLFVSDVERAVRWYRDNASLAEVHRRVDPLFGGATLVTMQRGSAGVTLVGSPRNAGGRFPQMVCFVLDGPPAPPAGTAPLFLADPDGTFVELPPVQTSPDNTR
jgi:catechol 2,3-dioxygenase-like lactoylglutathione lyase family enzyme